jgi:SAM-dependent methyltransferase
MGQIDRGMYSILKRPAWFDAIQRLFVAADARRILVDEYIRPKPGDRILDIGCGTGAMLPYLEGARYTGLDPEPAYIAAARAQHEGRGTFIEAGVRDMPENLAGSFDIVIAIGVLHHLGDAEAGTLFVAGHKALKPGGRLVTSDPVLRSPQRLVARLVIRLDRGRSTRSQQGYVGLAKSTFERVRTELRSGLLRIPSDHCIVMCEKAPG